MCGGNSTEVSSSFSSTQEFEVSHGSTANLTNAYAPITVNHGLLKICIDIFLILVFVLLIVVLIWFWTDRIPSISKYFSDGRNFISKLFICVVLLIVLLILVLTVLIRNSSLPLCLTCCNYIRNINGESNSIISHEHENHGADRSAYRSEKFSGLNEMQLGLLRNVTQEFNFESNWTFSTPQEGYYVKQIQEPILKFSIKIVLIGSPSVGKTSIFHRILYNHFSDYYMATLGADLGHITLHLNHTSIDRHTIISIQLWDVAGSESFSELSHIIYKDATAFIIVADVNNLKYSESALLWLKDVSDVVFEPYVALFFNKIDTQISHTTSCMRIKEIPDLDVFSISAKTGEGVHENIVSVVINALTHEIDKIQ